MIKIRNLNKSYKDLNVFNDFSLDIEENKITCILGESGCGKTTLLNVLANLTDYQGEVDKKVVSYAFQTPNLFPNLTVKKNLELVSSDSKKIEEVLEKLKVIDKLNEYPAHLSGGQRQRVALARAILFKSDLMILDEPFSSLDLKTKVQAMNSVKDIIKKENLTMVFVTHDILEAVNLADRIVVLDKGKIVYDENKVNEKTEAELFGLFGNLN